MHRQSLLLEEEVRRESTGCRRKERLEPQVKREVVEDRYSSKHGVETNRKHTVDGNRHYEVVKETERQEMNKTREQQELALRMNQKKKELLEKEQAHK